MHETEVLSKSQTRLGQLTLPYATHSQENMNVEALVRSSRDPGELDVSGKVYVHRLWYTNYYTI